MTQTPDPDSPNHRSEGGDDRVSKLIDAVVGEGDAQSNPNSPPTAQGTGEETAEPETQDAPQDQDSGKDKPKLTRQERKAQYKLEKQQRRAKYDSLLAYYVVGTIDQLRESIREHGSFRAYFWHKWVKPIGSVVLIVVVIRSTFIDWNDVPTGSMEPTVLVGDRILVNKMAYALQAPLSGPKVGVPFTALQWDNPLDGIPSWQWGKPQRGDIVTFWNPSTGIRMVKRIVAQPGDTLELRGGVMTLTPADGSPTTATYVDTSPFPANTTLVPGPRGTEVERQTEDRDETILGETRSIQHIRRRWIAQWGIVRLPGNPEEVYAAEGRVNRSIEDRRTLPVRGVETDDGLVYRIQGEGIAIDTLRASVGAGLMHLEVRDGEPFIDGESVSYNTFAQAYLRPIAEDGPVDFNGTAIGVEGHTWLVDGEPATHEGVMAAIAESGFTTGSAQVRTDKQRDLWTRLELLGRLMMSSFGPVTAGEDEYYMVGDNRNNSHDSRHFGPVARSEITGEAIAIPASFHGRILQFPPKPRWERWFNGLD